MTEHIVTRLKGAEHRDWICHVPVFVVPSLQESCRCRRFLGSSATPWECGVSSWSTLRKLVEGPTAKA